LGQGSHVYSAARSECVLSAAWTDGHLSAYLDAYGYGDGDPYAPAYLHAISDEHAHGHDYA
jgi:hypothetical protein